MDRTVLTTCPRDCYDACGILVSVRDGKIRHVRGDPNHPVSRGKLCRKCSIGYNGVFLDPEERLTRPLRRTGPKGCGSFEPVTWDEALAEIAHRLSEIAAGPGAGTILNAHYTGTCSLIAGTFPMRFFTRLGAREVDPDSVCNKAGHVALDYMYGTSVTGFDPRTSGDSACILVWGANPSASGPHVDEHWLRAATAEVIVVDPVRTPTAAAADLHLQPFPGTDAALAFGLLHVIARDGMLDRSFLAEHALGWDEVEPLLAGCDLQRTEAVTGVAAELVERAARAYGRGPSLLWIGQGLQRQPTGGNVVRAVGLLPPATGNLGRSGAGVLYLNDHLQVDGDRLAGAGLGTPPDPVSHMDLAAWLEDRGRTRALVTWNINIAASNPEQARLRAALQRDDLFTVVVDLFATDTADLADFVLPAASFLEFDDLVASYFDLSLSAQAKAQEPLGESLPNQEIFRRLAAAMGFDEPELQEGDEELIAGMLAESGVVGSFAELAARGTVPLTAEPVLQFENLTFPTPSGRVELASAAAEQDGHPRVPQPTADAPPAPGHLRLLSPASPWLMNDSFGNDPKVRRRIGDATVALHPDDARALGVSAGEGVRLSNGTGSLEVVVELSDALPRGVAYSPKGRWPKRERQGANVNVLNPGAKSDMGSSSAVHGLEVRVEPTA